MSDIAGSVVVAIGVIEVICIEAINFAQNVPRFSEQLPELGRGCSWAGEAAGAANDGDGLVLVRHCVSS